MNVKPRSDLHAKAEMRLTEPRGWSNSHVECRREGAVDDEALRDERMRVKKEFSNSDQSLDSADYVTAYPKRKRAY